MPSCRRYKRQSYCEELCMEKLCSYKADAERVSQLPAMTVAPPKLLPEKIEILPPTYVSAYTYLHDIIAIPLVEKAFPQLNRVHSSRGYDFINDDKKRSVFYAQSVGSANTVDSTGHSPSEKTKFQTIFCASRSITRLMYSHSAVG